MYATDRNSTAIRIGTIFFLLLSCALCSPAQPQEPAVTDKGWSFYGGDPGGSRYSSASQISRENVAQLKVAWTFHTGALQQQTNLIRKAAFEATPILVDDKLFLTTPYDQVL